MKYLIGLLIAIAVIIFIIIKLLFSGGGKNVPKQIDLDSYAGTNTVMRMTLQNATQASQTHREVEITVGQDETTLTVYKGYQGDEVRSKTYPMNSTSYGDFLRGLQTSGKYNSGEDSSTSKDQRGYCPTGDTYVYEIVDEGGNVIQHYWSTSCGLKTFKGNDDLVQAMFKTQVPDYDALTSDVQF